jgi:protein phosphatase
VADSRYLPFGKQIFLDTEPGKPPTTPEEVPQDIVVYLQLFSCYPHIPQAYDLLNGTDIWLFDYGTVPSNNFGELNYPQTLIPKIEDLWIDATPLQQLNWLWQIAKLWKPLQSKNVASTLIDSELIRVNGQIVQLIQLSSDRDTQPSLQELGELWSIWAQKAHPSIREMLIQLAISLKTGVVNQCQQIIAVLERALDLSIKTKQYAYQIYALSDSGPSRNNNEDAAYPIYEDASNIPVSEQALAIVCDGVGGHDGGEIASGDTIEYLRQKISGLSWTQNHSSREILDKLSQYINQSNDRISKRNDEEQRHERQRMGTTLVMALAHANHMYLGHVGDSRIYWITRHSCHQLTIDDDLASREDRLGYALYRDSLQYPSAGALIQAIGMRDSTALHPNLQHYIIDDDCIFLLCSDGLSDFDRIEQQWRNLLPVLDGKQDLATAVKNLITLANEKNGHDNATVALMHGRVTAKSDSETTVSWSDVQHGISESVSSPDIDWNDPLLSDTSKESAAERSPTTDNTEITQQFIGEPELLQTKSRPKWLKSLILLLIVSTIAGILSYYFLQWQINNDPDNDRSTTREEQEIEIE